jgi:hypothetical protein
MNGETRVMQVLFRRYYFRASGSCCNTIFHYLPLPLVVPVFLGNQKFNEQHYEL